MHMQLHAVDGRARDPGGYAFACESGCACPRERRAVGARPTGRSGRGRPDLVKFLAKQQPDRQVDVRDR
jgi:hypothetical protein